MRCSDRTGHGAVGAEAAALGRVGWRGMGPPQNHQGDSSALPDSNSVHLRFRLTVHLTVYHSAAEPLGGTVARCLCNRVPFYVALRAAPHRTGTMTAGRKPQTEEGPATRPDRGVLPISPRSNTVRCIAKLWLCLLVQGHRDLRSTKPCHSCSRQDRAWDVCQQLWGSCPRHTMRVTHIPPCFHPPGFYAF